MNPGVVMHQGETRIHGTSVGADSILELDYLCSPSKVQVLPHANSTDNEH